jgi:hypothetical protein
MNIKEELQSRLDKAVSKRNELERLLKMNDLYIEYLELQEEIAEVNSAVKALNHTCNPFQNQNQIQASVFQGRGWNFSNG